MTCSPSLDPLILALTVVFGKLLPVHKLCKKIYHNVHLWWREQCVSSKKKLLFVMQNLGIWGTVGGRGSKCVVESAIFRIADLDLPIHYATFMGLQWWLRVVYSWVPPLLSIFSRKTQVLFWAKIWRFGEINRGLKLNLSFITPYGTSLRDFTSFELSRVKIHPQVWPVGWSKKK